MTRSSKKKAYALQVLLVNNDVEALTTFKKVLESSGIGADAFHDPRTALRHFKPNKYGTPALNIRLPHMTGFELAHAIWREDPAVKICFLSSFEIPEAEAKKSVQEL